MTLLEYQYEAHGLDYALEIFLNEIFSAKFAKELITIYNNIEKQEDVRKDDVVALAFGTKKLKINRPVFYALSKQEQLEYITHELLHVAMNKGNFRLNSLAKKLWKFYNNNRVGADISRIMVGKSGVSKRWINAKETVPYLMNYKIDFNFLKSGSNEAIYKMLDESKLFNLNAKFWKEKLNY